MKNRSFIDEFTHFFEFGEMTEHLIAHDFVETIEEHHDVRHQVCLVLLHEFVEKGEDVFEEQLLLLFEDVLQLLGQLIQQVYSRTRQRVDDAVAEELQQRLQLSALQESCYAFLGLLADFGFTAAETCEDAVADYAQVILYEQFERFEYFK